MLRLGVFAILAGLTVGSAMAQAPRRPEVPLARQPAAFTPVAALEEGMNICKRVFATRHPTPPDWREPSGSTSEQSMATAKARGLSNIAEAEFASLGWVPRKFGPSTLPAKRGAWGHVAVRLTSAGCAIELYSDPNVALPQPALKAAAQAWIEA